MGATHLLSQPHEGVALAVGGRAREEQKPGIRGHNVVVDEGRLLARVRHPNVVTVFGAERLDGRVGIWMEFIDGETLAAEVQRHGPLPAAEITVVGLQLARALGSDFRDDLLRRPDTEQQGLEAILQPHTILPQLVLAPRHRAPEPAHSGASASI